MAPRVDTALSKALLDSGSLDPSVLEDAVQEQLIHGGTLDTILLEKGAVPERKLAELLSLAWHTDPVALKDIERPAAAAVKALPERMALAMRLCPFAVEGTAVHVMCTSPLDRALIEEVSAMLVKPLVPHVVPEVRLWQGLQHAYGTAPDERFASLLTDLDVPAKPKPDFSDEGAAIDAANADMSDPGAAHWDLVEALAHLAATDSRDAIARVATSYARKFMPFAAMIGVRDGRCAGWLRSGPAEGVQFANKGFVVTKDCVLDGALRMPSPSLGKPAITAGNAAFFGWLGRRRPRTFLVLPIVIASKCVGALVADGGIRARDFASMSDLVAFAARLGPAFEALLRQRRASLLPQGAPPVTTSPSATKAAPRFVDIHNEVTAPGLERAAMLDVTAPMPMLQGLGPGVDLAIDSVAPVQLPVVPAPPPLLDVILDVQAPPPLPQVKPGEPRPITMHAMPRVELTPPPPRDEAPVARLADAMRDGTSPFARNYSAARPMPERPVPVPEPPPGPIVMEDLSGLSRIEAPSAFADVTDQRATEAWREALFDAVEKGHQGGTVPPEEKARLFLDDDGWEDVRFETYDGTAHSEAVSMPQLVERDLAAVNIGSDVDVADVVDTLATIGDGAPLTDEEPPSPLAELVDALDALDDGTTERAKKQLLAFGLEALPALEHRFPGRLRVDPFDPGESVRTADKLGPLVEVLYAMGGAGLDAAVPHLDSRFPAHRFAAVLLFALTPDARGIDLLRARLHDQEPRIRQLAADALAPFVAHPRFEAVLQHLRERMQSPLLDARRRAVQLLGAFRDVGSVPQLMTLLESRGAAELGEDARQALRMITLQDFGVRARGWERWWTKAKKRSRVDWLIEGLSSEDREIRTVAHSELATIAGDDFGYRPDEPRKNRQRAVAVFQTWWLEEQRPKAS